MVVPGHKVTLYNPADHFSFVQPPKGCGNGRELVTTTASSFGLSMNRSGQVHGLPAETAMAMTAVEAAQQNMTRGCRLAFNAGFFNMSSSECHGNIVRNRTVLQSSRKAVEFPRCF